MPLWRGKRFFNHLGKTSSTSVGDDPQKMQPGVSEMHKQQVYNQAVRCHLPLAEGRGPPSGPAPARASPPRHRR